jgi:hypothetical protein
VSSGEWEMHQAIKDISSKEYPETIWVVAKPENVRTYLRIRKLLDQIQEELDLSWTVIGETYGYDSELREFGLKARRIRSNIDDLDTFSQQVSYIPIQASFEVADTDLLKLLIGPLYGEKAEIGIRELIQNSVDAVNELNEYQKHLMNQHLELLDQEGDVVVSIDQKENEWWLTVSDRGIGMTITTIKEYFLKAGASLRRSEIWKKTFEDEDGKSKILRSGRFGIGALAAFLVGDEIKVTTRHVTSAPENGVEFSTKLDEEAIEFKYIKRPIGTTISIKLSTRSALHLNLLPKSKDETTSNLSQGKSWDWYCLDEPKVVRTINKEILEQEFLLPKLDSKLPEGWHRIKHQKFEDIHWTYLNTLYRLRNFSLVCNGIKVMNRERGFYSDNVRDKYINYRRPTLSVFDFNANFPLNIQRTELTTSTSPFEKELIEDITKEFIASMLVETPTLQFPNISTINQLLRFSYYGMLNRDSISFWTLAKEGLGMLIDPIVFQKSNVKALLAICCYYD